jgi:hypothetical protein
VRFKGVAQQTHTQFTARRILRGRRSSRGGGAWEDRCRWCAPRSLLPTLSRDAVANGAALEPGVAGQVRVFIFLLSGRRLDFRSRLEV